MASEVAKTAPKINGKDKWEVENAADTLRRAEEIKTDAQLFKAAKKELLRRLKQTQKVLNQAVNNNQ